MNRESVQRWKSAWDRFLQRTSQELDDLTWCWYVEALLLYEREKPRVDAALRSALSNFEEWPDWKEWMAQVERMRPTASDRSNPPRSLRFPSELPDPPEEPQRLWSRAQRLLETGDRFEAIGGAVVRFALAKGRAAREMLAGQ